MLRYVLLFFPLFLLSKELDVTHKDIQVQAMTADLHSDSNHLDGYWGIRHDAPKEIIKKLKISYQTTPLYLPKSAYCDLGNPSSIRIEQNSSRFTVIIKGGDAASSYKAILFFDQGQLTEKLVQSGEFPDERWEKTRYSFVDPNSTR